MKNKNYLALGISVIALMVSIIAICVAGYRAPELSVDYLGVIVGVLALLVTVLIGWNIYTLIDIDRIRKEISKSRAD